ncbi:MAG TPA: GTP cyclohydrolase FolE2 [Burkholderiaceae bacterium]|nr:GTP cyclohydrolase FolE2 [Burkholderiaceae bacterium]
MKPEAADQVEVDFPDSECGTPDTGTAAFHGIHARVARSDTRASIKSLPDIQSRIDHRGLSIDAVGIKDVRYPLSIRSGGTVFSTVATLDMTVGLPATSKGTHMSRFIELLEDRSDGLGLDDLQGLMQAMLAKLDADSGEIHVRFPYFIRKTAPVSGVQSQLDYDVCWTGRIAHGGRMGLGMRVKVPATSLCPCSKEISDYGAHNQRSHIYIDAELAQAITIEELVRIAECGASCEVYGLLKREDEKYVTERAYDNPKFVEDLVRDVALALDGDKRITGFTVEAENFESIHNHSAYARISKREPA